MYIYILFKACNLDPNLEENKLVQCSSHESLGCASLEQCTDFSEGPWWENLFRLTRSTEIPLNAS